MPQAVLEDQYQQQQGAELFSRHCRECHGSVGEGKMLRSADFNPPAPTFLNSAYAEADPAYLFWRIKEGKMIEPFYSQGSVMPAFGPHFSERQIWQLVAYLRQRAAGVAKGVK